MICVLMLGDKIGLIVLIKMPLGMPYSTFTQIGMVCWYELFW